MRISILVTAALLALVSKASAVPVTLELSGTASGYGNFSLTDASDECDCAFSNVPYSLTYIFNVPAGATSYSNIYEFFPGGTPTATATINFPAVSASVPDYPNGAFGPGDGIDRQEILTLSSQMITQALYYHGAGLSSVSTNLNISLLSLFSSLSLTGDLGTGQFEVDAGEMGGALGNLTIDSLILNDGSISAVPEPSTWAMLLIGFAAIGFAGYRRASETVPGMLIGIHCGKVRTLIAGSPARFANIA